MFGHGSSVESANDAVRAMAAEVQRRNGYEAVQTAFFEGGQPDSRGRSIAWRVRVSSM